MAIALVAVGNVDRKLMEWLKMGLEGVFDEEVFIAGGMDEPGYAFNETRNQYNSTAILSALHEQRTGAAMGHGRLLGIVDHDLFANGLNFVFGEAWGGAAIIGIARLRQEFYGLPCDENIFKKRVLTEAVHELGHTYGLGHCDEPDCVMFFSNTLSDTDRKGFSFCGRCRRRLRG